MGQLSRPRRETLGPFGVEVLNLQVSYAPTQECTSAEAAHLFQQQLADAIRAIRRHRGPGSTDTLICRRFFYKDQKGSIL